MKMDDKLKMQRALLDHLEKESEKIQSLMDELLKSMDTPFHQSSATVPPGKLIQTDSWSL